MPPLSDLNGQRFGRLVVTGRAPNGVEGKTRWRCRCDCGNDVTSRGSCLRAGDTKSCGCLFIEGRAERISARNTTHGLSKTKGYVTYADMMHRCYNAKAIGFKNYGGRGITVCDRWRESIHNFISDMGDPPDGLSLDRIDNESGYSPDNCRWATKETQCNNMRSNAHLMIFGERLTVAQTAKKFNINISTLNYHRRQGHSIEEYLRGQH